MKKSMKVLWFSNTPANAVEYLKDGPFGGGWLKSLDKALQSEVELHVAFYYPKLVDTFKYGNTTYHPIYIQNWRLKALMKTLWGDYTDRHDLPEYLKIIKRVNPDIVHIHGTENPFGCLISAIKIPVIVSIQGCMTVYYHKFMSGFTKSNLNKSRFNRIKSIRQLVRQKSFIREWKDYRRMMEREQRNLKDVRFVMGRTTWDERITSVLAPQSTYLHGDELLRSSFYERSWTYNHNEKLIIHTTSSNSPFKGFETICETLSELNNILDNKVEWQVAGVDINDSIVKVTKARLKYRFPKSGLICLGNLNEDELVEKICNASIYVSPSHIENSPNSLCEAMMLGMPCIATCAGGTGSLLNDGMEGILVQDGDPWVMAGAILEIGRNAEFAKLLGRKARARALERHDKDRIISDLLNTYKEVLACNSENNKDDNQQYNKSIG